MLRQKVALHKVYLMSSIEFECVTSAQLSAPAAKYPCPKSELLGYELRTKRRCSLTRCRYPQPCVVPVRLAAMPSRVRPATPFRDVGSIRRELCRNRGQRIPNGRARRGEVPRVQACLLKRLFLLACSKSGVEVGCAITQVRGLSKTCASRTCASSWGVSLRGERRSAVVSSKSCNNTDMDLFVVYG